MNHEHKDTPNLDQQDVLPFFPNEPEEVDKGEFPAPIYSDGMKPPEITEEPLPADIKAANQTSKVVLFISFGILAVILFALLFFY